MQARNRSNFRGDAVAPSRGPGPARTGKRPSAPPSEPKQRAARPRVDYEDFGHEGTTQTVLPDGMASLARSGDVTTNLAAETQKTVLQSAIMAAKQYPRDMMVVRQKLLERCKNPDFAEIAMYAKPQGLNADGSVHFVFGPSIRFAEALSESLGNHYVTVQIVHDTRGTVKEPGNRILHVTAIDLEAINIQGGPIAFDKTVERKKVSKETVPLSKRLNSRGEPVYLVHATEDEVKQKHFAMASIGIRNWTLRICPRDLMSEAIRVIEETEAAQVRTDPSAALKRVIDGFLKLGIKAEQLRRYLGHDLERINVEELLLLRRLGAAIKDGHTTWREVVAAESEAREEDARAEERAQAAPEAQRPSRGAEVASRIAARKRGVHAPRPAPRREGPPPPPDAPDEETEASDYE